MHKYLHLQNELESLIEGITYQDGDKLPSIRDLAIRYECSKSTIIRTLEELEKRHLIYSVPKSGFYVVKKQGAVCPAKERSIDLATSAPDPDVFPYVDFQHCINKAIETYKKDLFIYGTAKGLPSLIPVIAKQLAKHQVFPNPHSIFITSGVQQALSLLCTIPFPNQKKKILIEQPSYHLFIDYIQAHKLPVAGIKRTAQGIDLDELEHLFRTEDIKFFYTMPRLHSPLGTTYTRLEKQQIVELAKKYDVYIVEDDNMADLEHDSKADPIFAYDRSAHTIYLKSYSKIIFPGLRLGIAVIPDALADTFTLHKRLQDIDSSMLSQAALEIYLKSGMFERHKQKIRESYRHRSITLNAALVEHAENARGLYAYQPPKYPGIHTHIVLDDRVSVPRLIQQLKKRSILLESADHHYLPDFPRENILKLNVSNAKEDGIPEGVQGLVEVLCKMRL
ncbi:PLP-dependent aminotransferase family protein [uncultured Brevibacillus sp.]|uniref:aminotransferase-like domain-containing protein n=1 Tax=uncultured Brevibacillus sp. TaxID=169970 RepID=UPI0025957B3A|nr:PLP-dependent aminotransferase family protein [uncultured Brevibacillus sp.]